MPTQAYNACPISCGKCCRFWQQVLPNATSPDGKCPNRGVSDCNLTREARPYRCNDFLCRAASAVIAKTLSLEEARYLAEIDEQSSHTKWDALLRARKVKDA